MPTTVEEAVRQRLSAELGGLRGSLESAFPLVVFTIAYVVTDDVTGSVIAAVATALVAFGVRLAQGSETRFVRNGLVGIVIAAVVASFTGQAQDAFLPGILQNVLWVVVLGGSLVARRPLGGYVVGAVLDDVTGWRDAPAIVRLGDRLTLVLLAPMAIRVAVQVPLYLAGAVGWLGVSRVVLGWPLHAAALAIAGVILLRGGTPLDAPIERSDGASDNGGDGHGDGDSDSDVS